MKFDHLNVDYGYGTQNSFSGTAEYISPEVLRNDTVGPECDFWSVGRYSYLIKDV